VSERKKTGRAITVAGAVALLAGVAAVLSNISTVIDFARTNLLAFLEPQAVIEVTVVADPGLTVLLALTAPDDGTKALEPTFVRGGSGHRFSVTANTYYQVTWQGAGVKAALADRIIAVAPEVKLRLEAGGETEELREFQLVYGENGSSIALDPAVPATLILDAATTAARETPSSVAAALPEFDRAAAIIGLFETGTTDCSRRISIGRIGVVAGCFGAGAPGYLSTILQELDGLDGGLDRLVGGDDARVLRTLATARFSSDHDADELTPPMTHLSSRLEFWATYERVVLGYYRTAATLASELGLVSERGALVTFSALIQQGPNVFRRAATAANEKIAARQAAGEAVDEQARISALVDELGVGALGMQTPLGQQRLQLFRTGRITRSGIDYDLDALGVTLAPALSDRPPTIRQMRRAANNSEPAAAPP
jgi:hypothetical protein